MKFFIKLVLFVFLVGTKSNGSALPLGHYEELIGGGTNITNLSIHEVNTAYVVSARDINQIFHSFNPPAVIKLDAVQRTTHNNQTYDDSIRTAIEKEETTNNGTSRIVLLPFMNTHYSWDAIAIRHDHRGKRAFYVRSANMHQTHPFAGMHELKGFCLHEPALEDSGLVMFENLVRLAKGSITETIVFSTFELRTQHLLPNEELSRRQHYNLPIYYYDCQGFQKEGIFHVVETSRDDRRRLREASEELKNFIDFPEERRVQQFPLFLSCMINNNGEEEISYPLQMKTKQQIPWVLLRFLIKVFQNSTKENLARNNKFVELLSEKSDPNSKSYLELLHGALGEIREGKVPAEKYREAFQQLKVYAAWNYDDVIITDLLNRIKSVDKGDMIGTLMIVQVAGEYLPHMSNWSLKDSDLSDDTYTYLEVMTYFLGKRRHQLSHISMKNLGKLMGPQSDDASSTAEIAENFLAELKEALEKLQESKKTKNKLMEDFIDFFKNDLLTIERSTIREKNEGDALKKAPKWNKFYTYIKESLKLDDSGVSEHQNAQENVFQSDFLKSVFPDGFSGADGMSVENRRKAFEKCITGKQKYTERYVGMGEYEEFKRIIRNNVGVESRESYWDDSAGLIEQLFFKKMGKQLLTPEGKKAGRRNYANDVLEIFTNLTQYLDISSSPDSDISFFLDEAFKNADGFTEVMTSEHLKKLILSGSWDCLSTLINPLKNSLVKKFKGKLSLQQGAELLLGTLMEQMTHLLRFPEFESSISCMWKIRNYYNHPIPHGMCPLRITDKDGNAFNFETNPSRSNGSETLARHIAEIGLYFPLIIEKFIEKLIGIQ